MPPDSLILTTTPSISNSNNNNNSNLELFHSLNNAATIFQQNLQQNVINQLPIVGSTNLDTSVRVYYFDEEKFQLKEHVVYAHRLILSKSPYFRAQLQHIENEQRQKAHKRLKHAISAVANRHNNQNLEEESLLTQMRINLTMVRDAINSFKVFINFLYGGPVHIGTANAQTLLFLSKLCQVPMLEAEINSQLMMHASFLNKLMQNASATTTPTASNITTPFNSHFPTTTTTAHTNSPQIATAAFNTNVFNAYLKFQTALQNPLQNPQQNNVFTTTTTPSNLTTTTNTPQASQLLWQQNTNLPTTSTSPMELIMQRAINAMLTASTNNNNEMINKKSLLKVETSQDLSPTITNTECFSSKSIGSSSSPLANNNNNNPSQNLPLLLSTATSPADDSSCGGESHQSDGRCSESSSSANGGTTLTTRLNHPNNEMLVPSNDKEGWCRNKKYIQIVNKGYRCIVCNKIYGRYNSVSYHVTIYHRNPPIRCEQDGCQFTTREARYIHFHKYYRHQIPLPESIDLASRKCPLNKCKHVSKSPAMLDKHIHRHVTDCLKEGLYQCVDCGMAETPFSASTHEKMYEHFRIVHAIGGVITTTTTSSSLLLDENSTMEVDVPPPSKTTLKTIVPVKEIAKTTENIQMDYLLNSKENIFKNCQQQQCLNTPIIMPTTTSNTTTDLFFAAAAQQILAAQKAFMASSTKTE